MEDNNQMLKEILEIVNFLRDNSVTKEEFGELKGEFGGLKGEFGGLKGEFGELRSEFNRHVEKQAEEFKKVREEIIDHVDGFVMLHQHLEIELAAAVHKTNRLENHINVIAKHLQLQLD